MSVLQTVVVAVASVTWVGFAVAMRWYFRHARRHNPAKTWLTASASICTAVQMATLILVPPADDILAWSGIAGFAAANLVYWWSLLAHGKARPAFAFIPVAPTSLTRTGPYRLIRHPIYSAYLLAWVAGAVAAGQPWLLATTAAMGLFYYRAARQEEAFFATTTFAGQYAEYQKRTGMFLPRLVA